MNYWCALRGPLKSVVDEVLSDWIALLDNTSAKEHVYQEFLRDNAGFALVDRVNYVLAVSQLRFGADFISDFVLAQERGSYGFRYDLIEIESPHTPAFTADGRPSQRLNFALQQIRDWKHWLDANRDEAKRLFPSKEFLLMDIPSFSFRVVIGRRQDNAAYKDKLMVLAEESGVEIRSFDWFTDRIGMRLFLDFFNSHAPECDRLPLDTRNRLADPFCQALGDANWRKLVKDPRFAPFHMVVSNADLLVTELTTSTRRERFDQAWSALPENSKEAIRIFSEEVR